MNRRAFFPAVAFLSALLLFAFAITPFLSLSPVSLVHAQSAPVFPSGEITRSVDENKGPYVEVDGRIPGEGDRVLIGEPVTATGSGVTYSLKNTGTSIFGIDYFTGQLLVGVPLDHETHDTYTVTVIATDASNRTTEKLVTINVTDVDEPGKVTLSWKLVSDQLTFEAEVTDPDGIPGTPTWKWERLDSSNGANPFNLNNALGTYTKHDDDNNKYIRVTATYDDKHGTGKEPTAQTPRAVNTSRAPTGTMNFDSSGNSGYGCPRHDDCHSHQ